MTPRTVRVARDHNANFAATGHGPELEGNYLCASRWAQTTGQSLTKWQMPPTYYKVKTIVDIIENLQATKRPSVWRFRITG